MATLRNEDLTDRELLHVIADAADDNGLATSEEIALALGISQNGNKSLATKVSVRLSWSVRYGFLESIDPREVGVQREVKSKLWRITPIGEQLMGGRLAKNVESAMDRMDPGAQLLAMRRLTRQAYIEAGSEVANAVRREHRHWEAKRPKWSR
jgi:hypothetical protein